MKSAVIIIQARLGSKRLPRKSIAKIKNKPLIWYVIHRAKRVNGIKKIILATTKKKEDKVLVNIAKKSKVESFIGENNDVLDRYYKCALAYNADPIIRVTGDCPLLDPILISKMLRFYSKHNYDYVSNVLKPTYPDGLDVEIFSFNTLERIWKKAKLKSEREHVTSYIRNNLNEFRIFDYVNDKDLSSYRWTVDEKRDLEFVRKIYSLMHPKKYFTTNEILKVIMKNPKIQAINAGISRNEGYFKSLKKDKK
jgi:spore coat polysaccharide biosynthesis protein SpsF (cytidylyltransferase family)